MEDALFRISDADGFVSVLSKKQKIVITTHAKPDADALGSSLGLYQMLVKMGHDVTVITPTDYPNFLNWMKGQSRVLVYSKETDSACRTLIDEATLIFCVDFSVLTRIEAVGEYVEKATCPKVLIDHHEEPGSFADYVLWSTKAAATCELIYALIVEVGWKEYVNQDVAECLYAGIMTDTGSFKHPNTTKHVHEVVACLIDHGADIAKVSRHIYDANSISRIKLLGFMLSERLVVKMIYKTAYFYLSLSDQSRFSIKNGDTEGIVNYALSIKNIHFAAFFTETDNLVKISFRSVGDFSANLFSKNHFEGGGHKNAAGGRCKKSLEDTIKQFEALLPVYKNKLI